MSNKRYGFHLSTEDWWFTVGQGVLLQQSIKVNQIGSSSFHFLLIYNPSNTSLVILVISPVLERLDKRGGGESFSCISMPELNLLGNIGLVYLNTTIFRLPD